MKTRILGGGGRGVPSPPEVPVLGIRSDRLLAVSALAQESWNLQVLSVVIDVDAAADGINHGGFVGNDVCSLDQRRVGRFRFARIVGSVAASFLDGFSMTHNLRAKLKVVDAVGN